MAKDLPKDTLMGTNINIPLPIAVFEDDSPVQQVGNMLVPFRVHVPQWCLLIADHLYLIVPDDVAYSDFLI